MENTTFLRFAAILLIVNSHLDYFYPIKILATGGMIGNSIFFMLSAYGLSLSGKTKQRGFTEWYARRIQRVYPSAWVAVLLILLPYRFFSNELRLDASLEYLGLLFYPPFWFLQALMAYYLMLYFIIKEKGYKGMVILGAMSLILYIYIYMSLLDLTRFSLNEFPFRLVFYLLIIIYGAALARKDNTIQYSGPMDFVWLFASIFMIYLHKFMMHKNLLPQFQIVQHISIFFTLYYALKAASSPLVLKRIMTSRFTGPVISLLAGMTLEIYIAHTSIQTLFASFNLKFPVNIFLYIAASMGLAFIIKHFSEKISDIFQKL